MNIVGGIYVSKENAPNIKKWLYEHVGKDNFCLRPQSGQRLSWFTGSCMLNSYLYNKNCEFKFERNVSKEIITLFKLTF